MAKKKEPNCGNCLFGKDVGKTRFDVKIFICKRYPPKQGDRQDRPGLYPLPMVNETEWCGEYKPEIKQKSE
jgi:hypothetical protein